MLNDGEIKDKRQEFFSNDEDVNIPSTSFCSLWVKTEDISPEHEVNVENLDTDLNPLDFVRSEHFQQVSF